MRHIALQCLPNCCCFLKSTAVCFSVPRVLGLLVVFEADLGDLLLLCYPLDSVEKAVANRELQVGCFGSAELDFYFFYFQVLLELALGGLVTSLAVIPSTEGAVADSRLVRDNLMVVVTQPFVIVIVTQLCSR